MKFYNETLLYDLFCHSIFLLTEELCCPQSCSADLIADVSSVSLFIESIVHFLGRKEKAKLLAFLSSFIVGIYSQLSVLFRWQPGMWKPSWFDPEVWPDVL